MPLAIFVKGAAGPNFGPYQPGDRASLTSQTISDLGDAVILDPSASDGPTEAAGVE